jgi:hypothetical protein
MKTTIFKTVGTALLLAAMGGLLMAQNYIPGAYCPSAPEIDAASASNALVLLGGALLLIRSRKR